MNLTWIPTLEIWQTYFILNSTYLGIYNSTDLDIYAEFQGNTLLENEQSDQQSLKVFLRMAMIGPTIFLLHALK